MKLHACHITAKCVQWYLILSKRGESFCLSTESVSQGCDALHPLHFSENGAVSFQ